jgi:glycosyltransferase involved in cell wall biosynthesis
MRVAVLGLFPSDPKRIVGGVEAATLRLCEGLSRIPGNEVHAVVSSPGFPVGTRALAPNWNVHSIGTFDHFGNILLALPDRRRMVRALRAIRPDIVHAHSADRHALAALDSGLPAVVTIHGVIERETRLERSPVERFRGLFRDRMVNDVLRRARNVIYVSPYLRELYDERLGKARRWVVENPVGEDFFHARREEEPSRVFYAGLIIPRKGLRNLLAAVAIASKAAADLKLVFAGSETDAAYKAELERKIDDLNLGGRVTFLGSLPPERLAEEYARSAFVVLVSRQDTSPISVQEAMAAGKPVIGSTVGGIPHLVRDGANGFLVPYGDAALLADRMLRLLRVACLRRSMGEKGREEALRRFSIDEVARATASVYREVLASA